MEAIQLTEHQDMDWGIASLSVIVKDIQTWQFSCDTSGFQLSAQWYGASLESVHP